MKEVFVFLRDDNAHASLCSSSYVLFELESFPETSKHLLRWGRKYVPGLLYVFWGGNEEEKEDKDNNKDNDTDEDKNEDKEC